VSGIRRLVALGAPRLPALWIGFAAGLAATSARAETAPATQSAWQGALAAVRETWQFEITTIDGQPIRVATVVLAVLLFGVGLALSRRLSRSAGALLTRRLAVEAGAAAAVETIKYYALLALFTITALRLVNFPLTAFTILGGALAIGIGFGSQNVMNNFISGLILMLERPIRIGDLVYVEGTYGLVERIGARSTRIRASDSTHMILPNSFFLDNSVVNWTLSDDVLRCQVKVGVAYGSPTREVESRLRSAIAQQGEVLPRPEPTIVFSDFGDNALCFDCYFWVRARTPLERARIESNVRFAIDDGFREAGITIAFPQRDVHLDSTRPVEVRLLTGDGAGSEDR
jgi:potassium-dependent mechanosensitive channel